MLNSAAIRTTVCQPKTCVKLLKKAIPSFLEIPKFHACLPQSVVGSAKVQLDPQIPSIPLHKRGANVTSDVKVFQGLSEQARFEICFSQPVVSERNSSPRLREACMFQRQLTIKIHRELKVDLGLIRLEKSVTGDARTSVRCSDGSSIRRIFRSKCGEAALNCRRAAKVRSGLLRLPGGQLSLSQLQECQGIAHHRRALELRRYLASLNRSSEKTHVSYRNRFA